MRPIVIVFAKTPRPGRVKTRLIPSIGAVGAARVQALMTETTLRRARSWGCARVVLAASPAAEDFERDAADRITNQGGGDLGARLRRVQQAMFDEYARGMLIVGADAPDLPAGIVESALDGLGRGRVVICPSDDGGYCLIGVPHPMPALFEGISWGTPDVFEQTRDLATRSGVGLEITPPWYDVDEIEDLNRLRQRIGNSTDTALRDLHAGLNCEKLLETDGE